MNKKILVIDDEPDILRTLMMTLSQEEYHVTTATGGEAALEIFRRQPFDLVITDMRMPGMDGTEVIRRIKALDPDMEVIMLTGYATLENRALLQSLRENEKELDRQNQALRESELLKQTILDGITSTLCFVNPELEILWANRAVAQATNLSMKELVGRKCPDVFGMEPELCQECPLIKALKSGKTEQAIMKYPNGRILDVRAEAVVNNKGRPLGLLRIADDITEKALAETALRESERKYRELADSLPVKLFETDAKGTVTFLNPFALEKLQYTREDLIKGIHINDMLDTKQWDKAQQDVRKMLAEKSSEVMESVAKRKDGTTFPVLVNIHPILEENRLSGLRGFAVDITEEKRRLEEMTQMAKLESLGTLAGGIVHDFNNLLSIIIGNIELAGWDMAPDTPSALALKSAARGCLAAKELTGRFITFTRGGDLQRRVMAIGTLLRNTVLLSLSGSNVNCEFSIPEDLYLAELDEGQVGQVIQNLIQNAIEATPEGGTVKVCAENVEVRADGRTPVPEVPEGRYIHFEIQDEGAGILEEHKSKVFDPYFSTKARGAKKGMGLGLSIALSIVKKHGGFMLLESEMASGTTVSIYLPAAQEEKEAEHGPAHTVSAGGASKGRKVLVMDDEAMLRVLEEKMLQRLGYHVKTVKDTKEAVDAYRKSLEDSEPFDLVLLDLTVKGGPGGREALRELLKLNPDVKAVVCSGYADDPVMSNYGEYGFRASLAKPFQKASLEDALKKAMA